MKLGDETVDQGGIRFGVGEEGQGGVKLGEAIEDEEEKEEEPRSSLVDRYFAKRAQKFVEEEEMFLGTRQRRPPLMIGRGKGYRHAARNENVAEMVRLGGSPNYRTELLLSQFSSPFFSGPLAPHRLLSSCMTSQSLFSLIPLRFPLSTVTIDTALVFTQQ